MGLDHSRVLDDSGPENESKLIFDMNGISVYSRVLKIATVSGTLLTFSDGSSVDLSLGADQEAPEGVHLEGEWNRSCGLIIEGMRTGAAVVIRVPGRNPVSLDFLTSLPPVESAPGSAAEEEAFEREIKAITGRSRT